MKIYKRYVDVVVLNSKQAKLTPLFIVWDNNIKYPIDKILQIKKAHSSVGGGGIMYLCLIQNQRRKLYFERDRWFIESFTP